MTAGIWKATSRARKTQRLSNVAIMVWFSLHVEEKVKLPGSNIPR